MNTKDGNENSIIKAYSQQWQKYHGDQIRKDFPQTEIAKLKSLHRMEDYQLALQAIQKIKNEVQYLLKTKKILHVIFLNINSAYRTDKMAKRIVEAFCLIKNKKERGKEIDCYVKTSAYKQILGRSKRDREISWKSQGVNSFQLHQHHSPNNSLLICSTQSFKQFQLDLSKHAHDFYLIYEKETGFQFKKSQHQEMKKREQEHYLQVGEVDLLF